ncbi:CoA activase [Candidatus Geothermarchaeota archaeon ex4572_27]|nr:MAG: CoA activase [Candidatus Geothermarchaeota archaeon ex4572_27]
MIAAGIDLGARTVKAVIFDGSKVLAKAITITGFEQKKSAEEALDSALKAAGISRKDVEYMVATGAGRKVCLEPPISANREVTEVIADAAGAVFLHPAARTVIDVGAEEGRAARVDEKGSVKDFVINERCAAGAGTFVEAMARALEVSIEEMGPLALKSTRSIPMNAQCTVFAESEVVTLIHEQTPKEDIARAIVDSMAARIASMVRRVGIEKDVVLVGGVAKNVGFVEALKRELGVDIVVPQDPEFVGALGAAIIASRRE